MHGFQLTWMKEFFVKFSKFFNTRLSGVNMIYYSIWIVFTDNAASFLLNILRRSPRFMDVFVRKITKNRQILPENIRYTYF